MKFTIVQYKIRCCIFRVVSASLPSNSRIFLSLPAQNTPRPISHSPVSPHPHFKAHTKLPSASTDLPLLDISYGRIIQYVTFCDFLHLASFQGPSMLYHVSVLPSFLLNNIVLYGFTTCCLYVPQLVGIWVVSMFWLLSIMLRWTFVYNSST